MVGLSTSLRSEASAAGVRVSALCPGLIRTPIITGGVYGKILVDVEPSRLLAQIERTVRPYDPAKFARGALRAVARNQAVVIVPARWRLVWWSIRLAFGPFILWNTLSTRLVRQRIEAERLEQAAEREAAEEAGGDGAS